MLHVECQCGKQLTTSEQALGKQAMCPACRGGIRLLCSGGAIAADDFRSRLVIARGPQRVGEQLLLGGDRDIGIGSAPGRTLQLTGDGVGHAHCRLIHSGHEWMLQCDGGSGPTLVNGEAIAYRPLKSGDVITVGDYELKYVEPVSAAPKPAPPKPAAPKLAPPPLPRQARGLSEIPIAHPVAQPVGQPVAANPFGAIPLVPEVDPVQIPMAKLAAVPVPKTGGPICPSCEQSTPPGSRICTDCGIDMQTGRPVIVSQGIDEDEVETRIRWLSWIFPAFIYPVASEAYGHAKPITVWAIAGITVLISIWFWIYAGSGEPGTGKNLLLWGGDYSQPMVRMKVEGIEITSADDPEAIAARLRLNSIEEIQLRQLLDEMKRAEVEEKGEFYPWQLLTHQLLHDGVLHLAGNLLFLLVLGSRVNAMLGNAATALLYPILGALAGVAQLLSGLDEPPAAGLGASGAIMGLAGMYLVLFPVHRIHMAIWVRTLFMGFRVVFTVFAIRGFWVVLAYVAIDVVATLNQAEDGVARWAHMGGFAAGAGIALVLLLFRAVNTHGGDVLSVALGRYAWPLIGKPSQWRETAGDGASVAV